MQYLFKTPSKIRNEELIGTRLCPQGILRHVIRLRRLGFSQLIR